MNSQSGPDDACSIRSVPLDDSESTPLLERRNSTELIAYRTWTVYACFLCLGLGTLLPWNFFITAESYWQYKFRNTSNLTLGEEPQKTHLQSIYTPMLVCLSQITNFSFLLINAIYSNRFPIRKRLVSSLVVMLVLFFITTVFVKVPTDSWQNGFFGLTMIMIVLLNSSGAIFQGGLFGLAGMFPPQYTTAVVTGQAIGGVFASLARIVSLAAGADDVTSALIYFSIAVGVMIVTLGALFYLFKTKLYQHHTTRVEKTDKDAAAPEETETLRSESVASDFKRVAKEIWPYCVSVFFVFFVTLSVFPSVCVHIVSTSDNAQWSGVYFQPVMTFLLFNVADYMGRQLGGVVMWPRRDSKLLYVFTCLRLVFIPLMMVCNHGSSGSIPSLFVSDAAYFFVMLTFGLSNGYLGTLCMIFGPASVFNPKDAQKAGQIMAASLGAGLLAGGMASFGFGSLYF